MTKNKIFYLSSYSLPTVKNKNEKVLGYIIQERKKQFTELKKKKN